MLRQVVQSGKTFTKQPDDLLEVRLLRDTHIKTMLQIGVSSPSRPCRSFSALLMRGSNHGTSDMARTAPTSGGW